MIHDANHSHGKDSLSDWLADTRAKLDLQTFSRSSMNNVTLLAYFFWNDARVETQFDKLECAFLCAYKCFGWMPGVIVVNQITKSMKAFAAKYDIRLIDEPYLHTHGGINALCIECISRMHTRFSTDYVLTLQTDGMPVNPGLEKFLGKYDYIGAPWPGHTTYLDWYPYPKYGVGNGGFSLRSKQICEAAARAYDKLKWMPFIYNIFCDDIFYCKVMPFFNKNWRNTFTYAPLDIAAKFSIESDTPFITAPPIGFHAQGFNEYVKRFGLPMADLFVEHGQSLHLTNPIQSTLYPKGAITQHVAE